MRIPISMIVLAVFLTGCGDQAVVGQRYRVERGLWNSNRDLQRLSIRPDLVTEDQWLSLAAQYNALASGAVPVTSVNDTTAAGKEAHLIQTIKARALITAARIYSDLGDASRMMEFYDRVDTEFADVLEARAEVAWARGQIAEGRGQWALAAAEYQGVVDRIAPVPGAAGLPGIVMELPLRIARLTVKETGDSTVVLHDDAGRYYDTVIRDHPGSSLELEAKYFRAHLAADLREWTRAVREFRSLEKNLLELDSPPRNPAEIRFLIGMIQLQGNASPDSSRQTFLTVLEDYPEESVAPRSLRTLAGISAEQGQIEEALTYLDRIRDEYPGAEQMAAEAMLTKGRLLDRNDRWPEARAIFGALPKTYPRSEPALLAPLEVVAHNLRVQDKDRTSATLETAEREYREFTERYPSGPLTFFAREKLVQVLYLQERYEEAVSELTLLGESLSGTPQGATLMVNAAKMAYSALQDTAKALEILDRTGTLYAKAEIGRWASAEASRLRKEME